MVCFDEIFYLFLNNYFFSYQTNLGHVSTLFEPNWTILARIKNEKKSLAMNARAATSMVA